MSGRMFLSSLIALSSLVVLSSAQFQDLPDCAAACVATASASSSCPGNLLTCLCNKQEFINSAYNCIYTTCPIEDQAGGVGNLGDDCAAAFPVSSSIASVSSSASVAPTASSSKPSVSNAASASSSTAPATTVLAVTPTVTIPASGVRTITTPAAPTTVTTGVGAAVGAVTGAGTTVPAGSQSTVVVVQTQSADTGNILNGAGAIKAGWVLASGMVGVVGLFLGGAV